MVDNAYGVQNQAARWHDGRATAMTAENNWWGLRFTRRHQQLGPAISPTTNPPVPENPVNGTPLADPTCVSPTGAA